MNDDLLQDLLERVKQRFYGKYRGTVTDVDAATMRIKARVPAVLPRRRPAGACPAFPMPGRRSDFVMLPEIGSGVWIEFEGGDVSFPIWTGCYWRTGDMPSAAPARRKDDHHQGRQPGVRQRREQRDAAGHHAGQPGVRRLQGHAVRRLRQDRARRRGRVGQQRRAGGELMPALLTVASTMMCPHGGTVTGTPGATNALGRCARAARLRYLHHRRLHASRSAACPALRQRAMGADRAEGEARRRTSS